MVFNVTENDSSDFATLTEKAFVWERFSTEIMYQNRDGSLSVGESGKKTIMTGSDNMFATAIGANVKSEWLGEQRFDTARHGGAIEFVRSISTNPENAPIVFRVNDVGEASTTNSVVAAYFDQDGQLNCQQPTIVSEIKGADIDSPIATLNGGGATTSATPVTIASPGASGNFLIMATTAGGASSGSQFLGLFYYRVSGPQTAKVDIYTSGVIDVSWSGTDLVLTVGAASPVTYRWSITRLY
jgi:hypothetical protein